jgi:hypothetical protein
VATPAWREFEKLAYDIQKEFARDAVVTLHDSIRGVDSGVHRQIDISIRQQVGQYSILVVADCKAHHTPLDINTVEQFATTVRDVRANKGALIASRGFTQAALDMARTHGIDTFTLVDTAHANWRAYVSIPTLLERNRLKAVSFSFTGRGTGAVVFPPGDPGLWQLYDHGGAKFGTARDIFARKWNRHDVPLDPGRHEVVLMEVRVGPHDNDNSLTLSASFESLREYYFGSVPIHTRGFQDAQTGGLITRRIATDDIVPYEIEQGRVPGWRRIDDPEALAVRPVMHLGYSDTLPTSEHPDEAQADSQAGR